MLFRRLNWNIVGWFRTVSTISSLIIAIGFGSMIYNGFKGGHGFQPSHMLRLGLSFTGGTDIAVKFTQPTTADKVKQALAGLGLTEESVTTAGTEGKASSFRRRPRSQTIPPRFGTRSTPSHPSTAQARKSPPLVRRWAANI